MEEAKRGTPPLPQPISLPSCTQRPEFQPNAKNWIPRAYLSATSWVRQIHVYTTVLLSVAQVPQGTKEDSRRDRGSVWSNRQKPVPFQPTLWSFQGERFSGVGGVGAVTIRPLRPVMTPGLQGLGRASFAGNCSCQNSVTWFHLHFYSSSYPHLWQGVI